MVPALKRQAAPLRSQATSFIRQQIVSGNYSPGQRLVEKQLEEELGVSRTVVREALRQLETQKLITLDSRSGPKVAVLARSDVAALYDVRAALEGMAARLAADHATTVEVQKLYRLLQEFRDTGDTGDTVGTVSVKDRFYSTLIDVGGNEVLEDLLGNVQSRIALLRSYTLGVAGRVQRSFEELSGVVEAIEAHDAELAERRSREHVHAAKSVALTRFAS